MSSKRIYHNFLNDRRNECSNLKYVTKPIKAVIAYNQERSLTPSLHKEEVLRSPRIKELIEIISKLQNVEKKVVEEQVRNILNEIGYNKNFKVIRTLGFLLTKICLKTCSGIYVNIDGVSKLKNIMGDCPVIFVPSHRSYADFIQLSFVCFTYDLAIPAIAAGMDFHGMLGMGKVLRDTGAFFMRRTYNNDDLYWTTFKQYVYQLVTKGDLPIEFFIEGTRSRSGKSLTPKYGLISMVLRAFFLSQVPDVLFVPISISYDRVLEENLFAFELLGVPKPKESTSGFLKSLKILKEEFGNTYFHFGTPISSKTFFGNKLDRTVHNLMPLHQQDITDYEKSLLPPLAYEIVRGQQKCSVLNAFNLIAILLTNNISEKKDLMSSEQLMKHVWFLKNVMEVLGAYVPINEVEDIINALKVHKNIVKIENGYLDLIFNNIVLDNFDASKLKGAPLSNETMSFCIPFVMLQLYVNPTFHYLIDVTILVVILKNKANLTKDELLKNFQFLRSLFSVEFVSFHSWIDLDFNVALDNAQKLNLIKENETFSLGEETFLQNILCSIIKPFLDLYYVMTSVLQNLPSTCDEKSIFLNVQSIVEILVMDNDKNIFVHPYCLNLDSLTNCLSSLGNQKAVIKSIRNNKTVYEIIGNKVATVKETLEMYMTTTHLNVICPGVNNIRNKL